MLKRNLVRILGAASIIGMLIYLIWPEFRDVPEGYEHISMISVFNWELFIFMAVAPLGCMLVTHGVGRMFAVALHVLAAGGPVSTEVLIRDVAILDYFSRVVLGFGRLAMLLGIVMALRDLGDGCFYGPARSFSAALLPLLYAGALNTLLIGPARETLRGRMRLAEAQA
jgi:hypothetical protein